jgi:dTDP-glucose 4,6-dehydratase
MILVTGDAGFIGSNFVVDRLALSALPVTKLDKVTYAGNLGVFASLAGDPRCTFVRGDMCDTALCRQATGQARGASRCAFRS